MKVKVNNALTMLRFLRWFNFLSIHSVKSRQRQMMPEPCFFLYLLHPSGRVSKSTIFSNHNLISVRHRKYRLIILLYLHVISCSSLLDLASSRDPEPRPSLESSNHSGLDLMLASIVESDLVFGYVSFSVSALNIQR